MKSEFRFRFGEFSTRVTFLTRSEAAAELEDCGLAVFDRNTVELFSDFNGRRVVLPAGETAKEWESVRRILESGFSAGLSRRDVIAGAGGGVICDMSAFAASLYMRGLSLLLVPTTLLAMVDASLGGKTGINFSGYKNMVGTFYPAGRILVAAELLGSLPEDEMRSGLAEVIKTAMLGDPDLLPLLDRRKNDILSRNTELLQQVISRCIRVKGSIVEADLRERGIRAHLNLGHTFGHALESVTGFSGYTHGDAVAWGIGRALDTGVRLGLTDSAYAEAMKALLRSYGFPMDIPGFPVDGLLSAMARDKKKGKEGVVFILQKAAGETVVTPVDMKLIREVLSTAS